MSESCGSSLPLTGSSRRVRHGELTFPASHSLVVYSKTKINFKAQMSESDGEIYIFYSDEASVGIKTMRK